MGIKNFVCDQLVPSKEDPDVMVPCTFKSTHPGSLPRHLFRKHGVKYPLHERRKTRAQAADAISKAKRGRKNRKGKQTHVPSVTGEFGPCIPALSTPNLLFADLPALTGSSTQGSASPSGSTSSDSEPDYRAALLNGLSMSSWSNDFDVNFMLEPSLAPPYREDGTLDFGSGFAACSSYPAVASSSSSDPFADVDLLSGLTFPSMGSDLNNQMGLSTTNNTPFDVVYSGSQQEFGPFVSTQEDKVYVPPQQPFNLTGGGYISESNNHSLYNAQSSTPFTLPASQEFPGFESAPMYTFPTQGNLGFSSFQPYETNSLYPSMNSNLYF